MTAKLTKPQVAVLVALDEVEKKNLGGRGDDKWRDARLSTETDAAAYWPKVNARAADEELARQRFDEWRADPVKFVRDNFGVEPDAWQADFLRALVTDRRIAMSVGLRLGGLR